MFFMAVLAVPAIRRFGELETRRRDSARFEIERANIEAELPDACYLEIEKMRFGDRLEYEISLEPGIESIQVPSLLLQPLVENAIIHGLSGMRT